MQESTQAQLAADALNAPLVTNAVTSAALVTSMSTHDSVRLRRARPRRTEIRIGTCDVPPVLRPPDFVDTIIDEPTSRMHPSKEGS